MTGETDWRAIVVLQCLRLLKMKGMVGKHYMGSQALSGLVATGLQTNVKLQCSLIRHSQQQHHFRFSSLNISAAVP